MMKKTKKIGLYSMGLGLIFTGICIFMAQVMEKDIIKMALKFWPILLIFLGLEIIYANYKNNKAEDTVIRIDFLSVLIIIFLMLSNMALYGLKEIGIFEHLSRAIIREERSVNLEDSLELEGAKRLVIENIKYSNLDVIYGDFKEISYSGEMKIDIADDQEEVEIRKSMEPRLERVGDIVYMSFKQGNQSGYNGYYGDFKLRIPRGVFLEAKDGMNLKLDLDSVNSNLLVDNFSNVEINLRGEANLEIIGSSHNEDAFLGNQNWTVESKSIGDGDLYSGNIKFLEGKNQFKLTNVENIEVNKF